MQKWKAIVFNAAFALNCLLIFLLIFEEKLVVPAWVQLFGRMHPLLVHFPIVLLLLAAGWELSAARKANLPARGSIGNWLLLIAAFTAVVSAIMGLLLSREDGYSPETLAWHKWSGTSVSVISLAW